MKPESLQRNTGKTATYLLAVLLCLLMTVPSICISALYPPHAYDACKGKKPGQQGRIVNKQGVVLEGICRQEPEGLVIVIPKWSHLGENKGTMKTAGPDAGQQICRGKKPGTRVAISSSKRGSQRGRCVEKAGKIVFQAENR